MSKRPWVDDEQQLGIRPARADVYVSYAHEDEALARALRDAFAGRGLTVTNTDAPPSRNLAAAVEEAISAAGVIVVLLSRKSLASNWVRKELELAFATHERDRVIPIATEELDPLKLPHELSEQSWLYLNEARQAGEVVSRLIPKLDNILGIPRGEAPEITRIYGSAPQYMPLIGADAYIEELKSVDAGITVIVGQNNSGKTSLLRSLAYELRNNVAFTYWINGSDTGELSTAGAVDLILSELSERGPTAQALVAIDDVDQQPDSFMEFLKLTHDVARRRKIVLTTQSLSRLDKLRHWNPAVIALGRLAPDEILEHLLFALTNIDVATLTDAEHTIQSAGGSTLAFELCVQLLQRVPPIWFGEVRGLDSLIDTFFEYLIEDLSNPQYNRLRQLAHFPDLLPIIASDTAWMLPEDSFLIDEMLSWGVFKQRSTGVKFASGRLADYLRRKSPISDLEEISAYIRSRLPEPSDPAAQRILQGTTAFAELPDLEWSPRLSRSLVDVAIWQALAWRSRGERARAEVACRQAAHIVTKVDDVSLRVRIMGLSATLESDRGKLTQAYETERKAADLALAEFGPNSPISIAALANIATTLRTMGDLPGAVAMLKEVVAKYRAVLPANHPELLGAATNLAISLREAGLVEEAFQLLQGMRQEINGDWFQGRLNQVLAAVLADTGRLDEAARVLRGALERTTDPRMLASSEQLQTMANLAAILDRQDRHKEAAELRKRVLAGLEILVGPEHPSTISARVNYALSLFNVGAKDESISLLEGAAAVLQRVVGPDHPESLQARAQLAAMRRDVGDDAAALDLYDSVLSDAVRVLGPDHIVSLRLREDYATQLARVGDQAGSQLALRELYADLLRLLPPDHPMLLRVEASARAA